VSLGLVLPLRSKDGAAAAAAPIYAALLRRSLLGSVVPVTQED